MFSRYAHLDSVLLPKSVDTAANPLELSTSFPEFQPKSGDSGYTIVVPKWCLI